MQTEIIQPPATPTESVVPDQKLFTPLDKETRTVIPTDDAAYHLNRKSQTLRAWACFENGPIIPLRIHGRLAWPVSEIKQLLGGH